jgi:hypothetical protein
MGLVLVLGLDHSNTVADAKAVPQRGREALIHVPHQKAAGGAALRTVVALSCG